MIKRSGFVAIVGRPNVGKSTLMNDILGKKLSITSNKPQTTRHRILGVKTLEDAQLCFLDTPGIHRTEHRAMNRLMNKAALSTLGEVDVIIFMIDRLKWSGEDQYIIEQLAKVNTPIILAVNKIDLLENPEQLLPFLDQAKSVLPFVSMVPISAKNHVQVDELLKVVIQHLPDDQQYYSAEQITDRSDRFIASEIVREQLMRQYGQEIPYATNVMIDMMEEKSKLIKIAATIWVERAGQKAIVIGKQGEALKRVGTSARINLQEYFGKQIYLQLWVKVKENWADNERILQSMGFDS